MRTLHSMFIARGWSADVTLATNQTAIKNIDTEDTCHTPPGDSDPIAHRSEDGRVQLLVDHLSGTAGLAREMASGFQCGEWGNLVGLWHDLGKYSRDFQGYIRAAELSTTYADRPTSHIDHSTAGAKHAVDQLGLTGKLLAYVIAGHHGGLPDGSSPDSCLRTRLTKHIPDYSGCPEPILRQATPPPPCRPTTRRAAVELSMFIRMLFSCLVDADFLDTEAFMQAARTSQRQGYRDLADLSTEFFEKFEQLRIAAEKSTVNGQREAILTQCLAASQREMGFFSLSVPTGGGKTLASMAFALRHALRHGLRRVIYVIPFTSIIEQNASVFRRMLGDDAVLEHHCNFEPAEEDYRSRLAAENWDAPLVFTTNVQFFESLFANRPSRCRKLHNIAESVIILDEVQTLPAPYLLPCLESLKELRDKYRTSIVLCSATQPAVQWRSDFTRGLEGVTEIVDDPTALAQKLRRTEVTVLQVVRDADLVSQLKAHPQVLCIVNTRKHARNLYLALGAAEHTFHLSALMCPAHRSLTLARIRKHLKEKQLCRVISTQLIEAGVDIDFPVVYRASAGIDAIAQAAGRCNREGKLERGQVFVFIPEAGIPPGYLRQTVQAAEPVLRGYAGDILSLTAIEEYFKNYYWVKSDGLDAEGILASLQEGLVQLDFPFKTLAEKFHFIKEESKPVVIPFDGAARRLIRTLDYAENPAALSRRLQRYTVSVYPQEWDRLKSAGSIELKVGLFPILRDEHLYNRDVGLWTEDPAQRNPEELYV